MATAVIEKQLVSLGFVQLDTLSSAIGLGTIPARAVYAYIQAEAQTIRFREDGVAPTAAIGRKILTTSDGYWARSDLNKIKLIEETASAKANIEFFRPLEPSDIV